MDNATKEKIFEMAALCDGCLERSYADDRCWDCENRGTYYGALKMAEWKDQQFEEEKKRWIEKACKWFDEEKACFADDDGDLDMDFNEEFKKAMLEE